MISDEVQPGFGRTGDAMWGHQRWHIDADIATMGKPMGNGMPIGGVVAKPAHMVSFGSGVPYFNTFGGENVPIAAAQAVLDVIRDENLVTNSADKGAQLHAGMREILTRSGIAADVRGAGLYLGVEFVTDLDTKTPDPRIGVGRRQRDAGAQGADQRGGPLRERAQDPPPAGLQPAGRRPLSDRVRVRAQHSVGCPTLGQRDALIPRLYATRPSVCRSRLIEIEVESGARRAARRLPGRLQSPHRRGTRYRDHHRLRVAPGQRNRR